MVISDYSVEKLFSQQLIVQLRNWLREKYVSQSNGGLFVGLLLQCQYLRMETVAALKLEAQLWGYHKHITDMGIRW